MVLIEKQSKKTRITSKTKGFVRKQAKKRRLSIKTNGSDTRNKQTIHATRVSTTTRSQEPKKLVFFENEF